MDAAADVFAEKGFRSASLADVADRAGYTIGAVYSNFASKDEVFHALMRERLRAVEDALAGALRDDEAGSAQATASVEDRIERELDRLAFAEDAVPPGWWRLLHEYRVHALADPAAWADLAEAERRCREIVARHIERFAGAVGLVLPLSGIELAERTRRGERSVRSSPAGPHRRRRGDPSGGLGQQLREAPRVSQVREVTAVRPYLCSGIRQVRPEPGDVVRRRNLAK